jgi:hypothetical protein
LINISPIAPLPAIRCRNIAGLSERVTPHAILPEPDQPDSGPRVNVARDNYSVESGALCEAAPDEAAGRKKRPKS